MIDALRNFSTLKEEKPPGTRGEHELQFYPDQGHKRPNEVEDPCDFNVPIFFGFIRAGLTTRDGTGSSAVDCYELPYFPTRRSNRSHDYRAGQHSGANSCSAGIEIAWLCSKYDRHRLRFETLYREYCLQFPYT